MMQLTSLHFLFLTCPKLRAYNTVIKRMGPGSDHLGLNHVSISHNMCTFGYVVYLIALFLQFSIYQVSMKIVSTSSVCCEDQVS